MDDQNQAQVVTIEEAIADIKKWAAEKDWEKVKEGCEEVLDVNPDNKELKDLLDQANKALNPMPAAPAPVAAPAVTPIVPAPVVAPTPAPVLTPLEQAHTPAPTPTAQAQAPADIFKKTSEQKIEVKKEKKPREKGKLGMVVATIIFVLILGGLGYSFYMGLLNPFYDWILRLFGL
jgi:hypothetical protein